jgi:putative hydrolase of the HAD superfamily
LQLQTALRVPKAILFDLDGTLCDEGHAVDAGLAAFHAAHGEVLGLPIEALRKRWRELSLRYFPDFLSGKLSLWEQRRMRMFDLFAQNGARLTEAEADRVYSVFLEGYGHSWRAFPDTLGAIQELSPYRLAVLTNGYIDIQTAKLRATGLIQYFESVFTPHQLGAAKPDPEAFLSACRRIDCDPQDCIFVGDDLEVDVLASVRAGLRGVWVNRNSPAPVQPEVPVIATLAELRAWIAAEERRIPADSTASI